MLRTTGQSFSTVSRSSRSFFCRTFFIFRCRLCFPAREIPIHLAASWTLPFALPFTARTPVSPLSSLATEWVGTFNALSMRQRQHLKTGALTRYVQFVALYVLVG